MELHMRLSVEKGSLYLTALDRVVVHASRGALSDSDCAFMFRTAIENFCLHMFAQVDAGGYAPATHLFPEPVHVNGNCRWCFGVGRKSCLVDPDADPDAEQVRYTPVCIRCHGSGEDPGTDFSFGETKQAQDDLTRAERKGVAHA